jgi:hypothetical protein
MTDLEITQANFQNYFTDVRTNTPQPGQILTCYTAMADFIRGPEKRQIIDLLGKENKAEVITKVMRKLLFACEQDSIRVPLRMAEDLASGMSPKDVERKAYRFKIELFFYTWPEYVPQNDPHWKIIPLLNKDASLQLPKE